MYVWSQKLVISAFLCDFFIFIYTRCVALKPIFQQVGHSVFSSCETLLSLYSICTFAQAEKLVVQRREQYECVQLREKKQVEITICLMMPTQRQWGAALISVTCPCASHQLHYGSISHASSANWIAREVVMRTGARATSVLPLLQTWKEREAWAVQT